MTVLTCLAGSHFIVDTPCAGSASLGTRQDATGPTQRP